MYRFKSILLTIPLIAACNASGNTTIENDWPTDCLEKTVFYADNDGDGFGNTEQSTLNPCFTKFSNAHVESYRTENPGAL